MAKAGSKGLFKLLKIIIGLFLLLCFCGSFAINSAEAAARKVRVGYFLMPGYQELDEKGHRSGYGYDFLQKLLLHNDWKYEYVRVGSYSEALKALEAGQVDIVTSTTKTDERLLKYAFSRKPIGSSSTILTVDNGNERINTGDYTTYNGMRVGMTRGNSRNESFAAFARENGFSFVPVYYNNNIELAAALHDGSIDASVSSNLRHVTGEVIIDVFDTRDFYLVTRLEDEALMQEANRAIDRLYAQEPSWYYYLWKAHYGVAKEGVVPVTAGERKYLDYLRKSNVTLKVLINPKQKPYGYLENGKIIGVYKELIDNFAKRVNLNYEVLPVKDNAEYFAAIRAGQADIIMGVNHDHSMAENMGYIITEPFYEIGMALLTKASLEGEIKTIARTVNAEGSITPYLHEIGNDKVEFKDYETYEDCIYAVGNGECDATITSNDSCRIFILKYPQWNLTYEPLNTVMEPCVAVSNKLDKRLVSVINKAVVGLERTTIAKLSHSYILKDVGNRGLYAYVYENSLLVLALVVMLLLFIAGVVYASNRRKHVHAIQEKNQELETSRQAIREALMHAEHANKAKTNFLNNMSHDIRTPMNAIIGFTSLAITHIDKQDRVKEYLQKIMVSSNHLLSLINDVLDMSRIESGKVIINETECSLPTIMHDLRNILQSDIKAKNFSFFIDTIDVEHETIFCDKLRLNQVLLNLLGNAMKFTPAGGTVGVKVVEENSAADGYADFKFSVSDTGIGMTQEFLEHVFAPFAREENSTVSGIQGTGLGLAITKNIVNMMGGTIDVQTEKNKGSVFTVSLRLRIGENKKQIEVIKNLENMRALVADDSADTCVSVARMLKSIGMRSEWTTSGKEAVLRAKVAMEDGDKFKAYIIDWLMPDMNGIECVRRIRHVIGDDTPIIIMTAYDWSDIEDEAYEAGVTAFCAKPLFLSELYDLLVGLTSEEKAQAPAAEQNAEDDQEFFKGKRVLLVEDMPMNRDIASTIMEDEGIIVETAENGQIGVDMVKAAEAGYYDLVCMDIMMPVMDGYEATKAIRALEDKAKAKVPVIAMTANAFEEDKQHAKECGMDDFLSKPFTIEQLIEIMRRYM